MPVQCLSQGCDQQHDKHADCNGDQKALERLYISVRFEREKNIAGQNHCHQHVCQAVPPLVRDGSPPAQPDAGQHQQDHDKLQL